MSTRNHQTAPTAQTDRKRAEPDQAGRADANRRPRLRLVRSAEDHTPGRHARPTVDRPGDEAGTTTAEYTVVTGAAVAFGALLFKLLTSQWGTKILGTAFKHVIALLGF